MSTRVFLAVVSTILAGGAVLGGIAGRLHDVSPENLAEIDPQVATERVWRSKPARLAWRLETEDLQVEGPIHLEVDDAGRLVVVDFHDLIIRTFSPDGQLLRSLGDPDSGIAFASVTDLETTPSGELWVADNSSRRLFVFDSAGALDRMLELETWPYRIVSLADGGFVAMQPMAGESLFARFTRDGRPAGSFGQWIAEQERYGLALDGWLVPDGLGGFVYGALYGGFLAAFDSEGRQRFLVHAIDGRGLPTLEAKDSGAIAIDPEAQGSILSLSVAGDQIHLLGVVRRGLRRLGTIDTYDLHTGRYQFSRRVPEGCSRVVVTDDLIYTVGEQGIAAWRHPAGA